MAAVLALVAVAATAVVADKYMEAEGSAVPTSHSCELKVAPMEPEVFVMKALGGHAGCVDAADKTECCKTVGW